jgi:NAD(P)-dependent dehydrogenase (short-subunit alcohol dehydrogenase family)
MPIALVTGASRGVGRGVAIGLANAGFKVFATGRSILTADLPADVVRIRCDHLRNEETIAAFARVAAEGGALDLLVNSAWGGYERMVEDGASLGLSHSGNNPSIDGLGWLMPECARLLSRRPKPLGSWRRGAGD